MNSLTPASLMVSSALAEQTTENAKNAKSQQLEAVAEDFESVFLSMILKEMRNTLDEEGGFFGGEQSDSYGGLFDLMMGQQMAKTKPLGIAGLLVNDLDETPPPSQISVDA